MAKKNLKLNKENSVTDRLEKKHVHLILKNEWIQKFETIKKELSLSQDVDVLRTCLDQVYNNLTKEQLELRSELSDLLESFLNNNYLKKKHFVFNISDIINEAAHYWIQSRRSEINLHFFPFRSELSEEEQQVAMVLVEQQINYEFGMTLENICKFLPDLDKSRINNIIKQFLNSELLMSTTVNKKTYYYSPVS